MDNYVKIVEFCALAELRKEKLFPKSSLIINYPLSFIIYL
jgi:hypothetical protein